MGIVGEGSLGRGDPKTDKGALGPGRDIGAKRQQITSLQRVLQSWNELIPRSHRRRCRGVSLHAYILVNDFSLADVS